MFWPLYLEGRQDIMDPLKIMTISYDPSNRNIVELSAFL